MAKSLLILCVEDDILINSLSWPIRELGAKVLFYKCDLDIKRFVEIHEPDVVLLDMACGGPEMPSSKTLAWLKERTRSVRVVWDASDPPWHPHLEEYKSENTFHCVIAADGATNWPHRHDVDYSFPTPVDPRWYEGPEPLRTIRLGFAGSWGVGPRGDLFNNLEADGLLTVRRRGFGRQPYEGCAEFVRSCSAIINVAYTSNKRLQCKARCIEAALVGCLLFETRGSPLSNWLTPGVDYVEYETAAEVRSFCNNNDIGKFVREFGARARAKVLELDLPRRFWSAVVGE